MLKLAKLPDRTPVRITVTLAPELHQRLQSYAALYRATYGEVEAVADLIPYMLDAFLDSDRTYAKAQKEDLPPVDLPIRRGRRPRAGADASVNPAREA